MRLVSWNVHGCVGTDRRFDPDRIARALGELDADLLLLQEVGDNRGVHPPVDQATTLANALGLVCTVGITMARGPHGYGNATLTRYPIVDSAAFDLSVQGREPRLCLHVLVDVSGCVVATLNVHLGLGPGERRAQLRTLLPLTEREERVVLAGDFNDFPPGPVSRTLRHRMSDVGARLPRRRTFPAQWPLLRLDRIYVSSGLLPIRARVERGALFRAASDHLPLVTDLEVRDDLGDPSPLAPLGR
jgi:endonuclease/exonuclease/phosphatase family metal-dependent hydrolase